MHFAPPIENFQKFVKIVHFGEILFYSLLKNLTADKKNLVLLLIVQPVELDSRIDSI